MTVPVDFVTLMGTKSTIERIRRKRRQNFRLCRGTVITVPYGLTQ